MLIEPAEAEAEAEADEAESATDSSGEKGREVVDVADALMLGLMLGRRREGSLLLGKGDEVFVEDLGVGEDAGAKLDESEVKLEELLFVWDNGP